MDWKYALGLVLIVYGVIGLLIQLSFGAVDVLLPPSYANEILGFLYPIAYIAMRMNVPPVYVITVKADGMSYGIDLVALALTFGYSMLMVALGVLLLRKGD